MPAPAAGFPVLTARDDDPASIILRTALGVLAALAFVAAWLIVSHLCGEG